MYRPLTGADQSLFSFDQLYDIAGVTFATPFLL
jgi:hypothetical protein